MRYFGVNEYYQVALQGFMSLFKTLTLQVLSQLASLFHYVGLIEYILECNKGNKCYTHASALLCKICHYNNILPDLQNYWMMAMVEVIKYDRHMFILISTPKAFSLKVGM